MGMFDDLIEQRFRKDESGRSVFLPYSSQKPGYYIDERDEYKVKSLVKIYAVAAALINITGYVAASAVAQAFTFHNHSGPLVRRAETGAGIYLLSATILVILPALLLWNVYRGVIAKLCSSLAAVPPESIRLMRRPPSRLRPTLIMVWAGLIIIGIGVVLAVRFHP